MLASGLRDLRSAIIALMVFSVLLGMAYPAAITGIAQTFFERRADGSLIDVDGQVVGSSLVGQNFFAPRYFHSRPSAAGTDGYDGAASSGSNLGPTSAALAQRIGEDVERLRQENGLDDDARLPVDAVTTSASGLDPHISPAYARLQIARVAFERGLPESEVAAVVERHTDRSTLWLLGEPRVNVLTLNLAMDAEFGGQP